MKIYIIVAVIVAVSVTLFMRGLSRKKRDKDAE